MEDAIKPTSDKDKFQKMAGTALDGYIARSEPEVIARLRALAQLSHSLKIIRRVLAVTWDWEDVCYELECIYGKEGRHVLIIDIGRITVLDPPTVAFLSAIHERWQARDCFFGVIAPKFLGDAEVKRPPLSKAFPIFNSIFQLKEYIRIGVSGGTEF